MKKQRARRKSKAAQARTVSRFWSELVAGAGDKSSAAWRGMLRVAAWLLLAGLAGWFFYAVVLEAEVFRLRPDGSWLKVEGVEARDVSDVTDVFAPDNGVSLAFVDVEARRRQLLAIQWIRQARVSKVWPNAVRVHVSERAPVALVALTGGEAVRMIDAEGVLLTYRSDGSEGLPVLTGIDADMELRARQRRVRFFLEVMDACSLRGFNQRVSEVNVADLENAVVLAKHDGRLVQLELGNVHLRHRVEMFLDRIDGWRTALGPVKAVNLRLKGQIPVLLDLQQEKQS